MVRPAARTTEDLTMSDHDDKLRAYQLEARATIRAAIREAILGTEIELPRFQVEELVDAVSTRIASSDHAWALAYVAGVVMAPSLIGELVPAAHDDAPPAAADGASSGT